MSDAQTTAKKILDLILEGDGDAFLGIGDTCGPKWEKELGERIAVIISREMMPSVSIPSCWPADMPPQEPGVLTTTANPGTSVVWTLAGRK